MITKFKIFENLNEGGIEVDYYVVCHIDTLDDGDELNSFLDNTIGKVIDISSDEEEDINFIEISVEYENAPQNIIYRYSEDKYKDRCLITLSYNEIKIWSDDKEEVEIELAANKFNI